MSLIILLGIDSIRGFGTAVGQIARARRMTIYDDNGNVVRRGTMYSQRGTVYSQNGQPGSAVELRKRPSSQAGPKSSDSHVAFPTITTSIQEEEPTISQLLRREEVTTSPEPASPRPSFLGVRPGTRNPGAHKTSNPTPVTANPPAVPEPERSNTMPDLKDDSATGNGTKTNKEEDPKEKDEDQDATIKVQNANP